MVNSVYIVTSCVYVEKLLILSCLLFATSNVSFVKTILFDKFNRDFRHPKVSFLGKAACRQGFSPSLEFSLDSNSLSFQSCLVKVSSFGKNAFSGLQNQV